MKIRRTIISILGAVAAFAAASAQYTLPFTVPGQLEYPEYDLLGVHGTITFDLTGSQPRADVYIQSDDDSFGIATGFAFLKLDNTTNYTLQESQTLVNGQSSLIFGSPAPNGAQPWPQAEVLTGAIASDYFSVGTSPPTELFPGHNAFFSFTFDRLADFDAEESWGEYMAPTVPNVFIRWEGFGVTGTSPFTTIGWNDLAAVPEPRLIGALAVFGMGGFLLLRRRLNKKS
ncbi:MAG: hypothetical protein ACP5I4_16130 [Oceanipulchritudo sp.]